MINQETTWSCSITQIKKTTTLFNYLAKTDSISEKK